MKVDAGLVKEDADLFEVAQRRLKPEGTQLCPSVLRPASPPQGLDVAAPEFASADAQGLEGLDRGIQGPVAEAERLHAQPDALDSGIQLLMAANS